MSPSDHMFDESQPNRSSGNISPTSSTYTSYQPKRAKLTPACEVLIKEDKPSEILISDDDFDLIGRLWASKLRKLPENIQPIAEKAVNDTLFDFQMGKLPILNSNHSVQLDQIQSTIPSTSGSIFEKNPQFKAEQNKIVPEKCWLNPVVSTSNSHHPHRNNCKRPFSR